LCKFLNKKTQKKQKKKTKKKKVSNGRGAHKNGWRRELEKRKFDIRDD
jgi:hypothetical protein